MGEVCVLLLHCLWIWTYADLILLNIPLCFTVLTNIFIVHWMYSFSVMLDFLSIFRTGIKPQCGRVFILYIDVDSNHFRLASKLCVVFYFPISVHVYAFHELKKMQYLMLHTVLSAYGTQQNACTNSICIAVSTTECLLRVAVKLSLMNVTICLELKLFCMVIYGKGWIGHFD